MNAKERLLAKLAAAKAAASATDKDGVKDESVTGNTSNVSSSSGVSKESGKDIGPGETESELSPRDARIVYQLYKQIAVQELKSEHRHL